MERANGPDDDRRAPDVLAPRRRRIPGAVAFLYGLTAAVMVFAVLVFVWMYWLAGAVGG